MSNPNNECRRIDKIDVKRHEGDCSADATGCTLNAAVGAGTTQPILFGTQWFYVLLLLWHSTLCPHIPHSSWVSMCFGAQRSHVMSSAAFQARGVCPHATGQSPSTRQPSKVGWLVDIRQRHQPVNQPSNHTCRSFIQTLNAATCLLCENVASSWECVYVCVLSYLVAVAVAAKAQAMNVPYIRSDCSAVRVHKTIKK